MDGIAVADDVVTAGTALSGLILIYVGSLVTKFESYAAEEQGAIKARLQSRAWIAFAGMGFSLLAAALAVIGKWTQNCFAGNVAVWTLLASFVWAAVMGAMTVREIA